ncbi:MAG: PAS domain S-box protein [Candidatus Hydrogenedentes bacterium]|nr:PAS domain S-box protein [Candidatus Hydrogenedentota bacterium]
MRSTGAEAHRRLFLYVVPVFIGLGGIIFSQQLETQLWRAVALIISVALPLYAAGNLLARFRTSTLERLGMLSGVLLLILGAAFSVSGLSDSLRNIQYLDEFTRNTLRVTGMLSLFLGLFVVLRSVARTGEGIDEITERFRFLAEHISEGFILSRPEGQIRLVNQVVLDVFGMKREEMIGHDARELAMTLGLKDIVRQLDRRGEGVASEYEIEFKVDGEDRIFLVNGAPVFDQQGIHTLTMATIRDVTEHRQLARRVEEYAHDLKEQVEQQTHKLHQSEERLRQLLLSMNEGFLTLDLDHKIRFANAQAQAFLRTEEKSLLGRSIFDCVSGADRYRLLNLFAKAVEEQPGKGLRQEIELLDSVGVGKPTVIGVAYIKTVDIEGRGYSLVITPVADLKRMQQQLVLRARDLERANEELRQHDRSKDSFLSNVSHELRTPLTTIQGYIELFTESTLGEVTDSQKNALQIMDRNANHLLTHINEMIEFSRMQIRGIQIVANLYDSCALVRESAGAILPSAMDKQIEVKMDIPDHSLFCWGDREKLSQTFGILLNNAVKFTEKGGQITVGVVSENQKDIVFSVRDTGIGIDKEYHEKIFTRFFQVDSSKTRQYEGAGIGLAIARNIIHAHHGDIAVRSESGSGTTFVMHLPNALFDNQVAPEITAELGHIRILVIADAQEAREALCSFPPFNESHVEFASTGYQAARQLADTEIDLVVINDAPADVAGETTLRVIRKQQATCSAHVIVLTNEGGEVITRVVDEMDALHFIFKPFTAERIVKKIWQITAGESNSIEEKVMEELYQPPKRKPFVLVLDSDPGFLEWVEASLRYCKIDCKCTSSPVQGMEAVHAIKPDMIFIDADTPPVLGYAAMELFNDDDSIGDVPIYAMTGMSVAESEEKSDSIVAGILRKPFSISEMAEIINERFSG